MSVSPTILFGAHGRPLVGSSGTFRVDPRPGVRHARPPKPRRLNEPITVSLEEIIPHDHFYRHLETTLNLSFVREWVTEHYAERGRPCIDPVVFFNRYDSARRSAAATSQ